MENTEITEQFKSLVQIVERLRGPDGCPWDKAQTHSSLKPYLLEESYELFEAIDIGDLNEIKQELGDVLLQVMLHSQIAADNGAFDLGQVIKILNEKMIRRHPHVFADTKADSPEEVVKNWNQIKSQEKGASKNPFANIPQSLPALMRSWKIGQKSIRYNFDWENVQQVLDKLDEEVAELKEAIADQSKAEIELEIGDVLFSVAQVARHLDLEPEQALRKTNAKFETRFLKMKELCENDGKSISDLKVQELEKFWVQAKKLLKE